MKKQNFLHFIGIDISKSSFDVAVNRNGKAHKSYVFDNNKKGVKSFLRLLKNQSIALDDCLICMEHTGIYGKPIITKLMEQQANLCVEMSLKIIRSQGVKRGKNDKVDAIRIAEYAARHQDEIELYQPVPEILDQVKTLMAIRARLVDGRAGFKKYLAELESFAPEQAKVAKKNLKKTLKSHQKEIERIEEEIQKLILSDEQLNKTVGLVTSIPGIGRLTALHLTVCTNFFTRYKTPKQLACYCGVAPFEHSSGTSIHKRPRVSHMANKTLKKQLHLCAMSAKTHDPELKAYFDRKEKEGKSKMLLINNVRNKLVHRVCAVIKRQAPYEKMVA